MTAAPLTAEQLEAAPSFARGLAAILLALGKIIARAYLKNPHRAPLILPLYRYFTRQSRRFARAMETLGATPAPRRRAPREATPRGTPTPQTPAPRAGFPTRQGWLLADLRHEAACHRIRLEALLSEPHSAAILAASPRAASLLRPICHMLALKHPSLRARAPRRNPVGRKSQAPSATVSRPHPVMTGEGRPPTPSSSPPHNLPVFLAAPEPPQRGRMEPPCPHLANRWPWNWKPRGAAKPA